MNWTAIFETAKWLLPLLWQMFKLAWPVISEQLKMRHAQVVAGVASDVKPGLKIVNHAVGANSTQPKMVNLSAVVPVHAEVTPAPVYPFEKHTPAQVAVPYPNEPQTAEYKQELGDLARIAKGE